jgi:uncharacterized OB-fold protein
VSTILLEQPRRAHLFKPLTHCDECGRLSCEGDTACNRCGAEALERVSRIGEIYSYTTVNQSGGEYFVLALVQLSGGPMVMGRIVGVDRELKIGSSVEFVPDSDPLLGPRSGGLYFRLRKASIVNRSEIHFHSV